jgi:hypothetical protein
MTWWAIFQWISSNQTDPHSIYENLDGKSVGLKRFNPPGPCPSSRMDVSSFGCVTSLALQLVLNFIISSRTVDICRPVCRRLFGMYRGAVTNVLRTLLRNICKISIFEWQTVPYVHTCFSIVLYSSSLFVSERSVMARVKRQTRPTFTLYCKTWPWHVTPYLLVCGSQQIHHASVFVVTYTSCSRLAL